MKSWFISDLHLEDINERNSQILLRFLFELNKNPSQNRLFLVGDIFDVWVSDGSVFKSKFAPIIEQISQLKKNGGEVHYFEGNHDVHIAKFWTQKHNIPVYVKPVVFDLDGLKVRVEHGDYINPNDTAYIKYLSILRHPVVEWLGHTVPSYGWNYLATRHSRKSRKKTSRYAVDNAERIKKLIRDFAQREADFTAEKTDGDKGISSFDLLVTGHMHIFDDYSFKVNSRDVRSINLGSWLEKPRALKIENKQISIIEVE